MEGCSSIPTTFKVGFAKAGFAKIYLVTSDIQKAISGAELILVATTTAGHEMMTHLAAPYLQDGQTLVFLAGNASTLIIARILKELAIKKDITLAETSCMPYNVRRIGPTPVKVYFSRKWWCAAFPGKKHPRFLRILKEFLNYGRLPA